ncbi:MAG: 3'(2'),5'-bisphosphate nucleotidase CysQ [Chitinophagales bacterium]|jgi:3'(2'), 5'-bisphosphate nucleotidase|nr:3'(2'),5'-bisphosphate nucleotidase CysQ [Sphingobacteriales bacterium]
MYSSTTPIESIRIEELLDIAIRAGEAIMEIYKQPFEIITKRDGSPLTLADKNANKIITDYLFANYTIPILSEENDTISFETRKEWKQLWIIDPLDGTKEFIHKRREFTVNIALVENGRPVLGVIYAPVFEELYYAIKNQGCFFIYKKRKEKIKTKPALNFNHKTFHNINKPHLKVILSRSHNDGFVLEDYIQQKDFTIQALAMGSSLKFCRVAHGIVDMNIRMKPTSEWDTAAAQIILEEAGRNLVKYEDGTPLNYNKQDILNPYFVAY